VVVGRGRAHAWEAFDIKGLTGLVADATFALNGPPR
jgi:hypothetical protein